MSAASDTRKVELVAGVDVTTLPLAPLEGFVLSRIEGRARVADVLALSGLPADQLEQVLGRLVQCGAVRLLDASGAPLPAAPPSAPDPSPDRSSGSHPKGGGGTARRSSARHRAVIGGSRRSARPMMSESPISGAPPPRPSVPPSRPPSQRSVPPVPPAPSAAPDQAASSVSAQAPSREALPYDRAELEEDVDLPMERRKQVLALYYRLDECDYYEALGVDRGATRKEIRSAYFALSKVFHPDTMFRRELGSYKAKMEVVFNRITEAYDTLSKKGSRADYDAYLRATQATRATEEVLERAVELEVAVGEAKVEPVTSSASPGPENRASSSGPVPVRSAPTERGKDLTRRVVGQRLARMSKPPLPNRPSSAGPRSDPASSSRDSRRDALRGLTASIRQAGDLTGDTDRIALQLAAAKRAEAEGDLAKAQEHLRRAVSAAPDRGDVKREHARLSTLLARQLADDYAAQAEYEEKQGMWASAALSWSRVHEGRDQDPHAACRVAAALLQAGSDMRRAHEYAQKAVLLAPNHALHRITLAKVMLNIGLPKGAKRELEAAQRLDPQSEIVKNLLAELKG